MRSARPESGGSCSLQPPPSMANLRRCPSVEILTHPANQSLWRIQADGGANPSRLRAPRMASIMPSSATSTWPGRGERSVRTIGRKRTSSRLPSKPSRESVHRFTVFGTDYRDRRRHGHSRLCPRRRSGRGPHSGPRKARSAAWSVQSGHSQWVFGIKGGRGRRAYDRSGATHQLWSATCRRSSGPDRRLHPGP